MHTPRGRGSETTCHGFRAYTSICIMTAAGRQIQPASTAGNPTLRRKRTIMRNPTARITYPPNTPFPNTPFVAYRTAHAAVTARNHVALHSRSTQPPVLLLPGAPSSNLLFANRHAQPARKHPRNGQGGEMRSMATVDDSPTQRGCGERAIPVTGVTTTRGDGDSNCDWSGRIRHPSHSCCH